MRPVLRNVKSVPLLATIRSRIIGKDILLRLLKITVAFFLWHLGGFLLSIFYSGGKQRRFRCRECGELFYSHTAVSRGYRLLFLLFVAIIVNYIWSDLSEVFGE